MATGHGIDEYLETIYFLAFPIGEYKPVASGSQTIASRVGEMLGVSRASAGEMLKRLEAEGLVERGEHKEAILTEAGYTGYASLEFEGKENPDLAVPRSIELMRKTIGA